MGQGLLVIEHCAEIALLKRPAAGFRENRWSRRHAKPLIDRTPGYYGPLS
jgi:hypothetical protein